MKKVKVYTVDYCPHCMRAKDLLSRKKIPFEEIDLSNDDKIREKIQDQTGWMTVPMIFIGDDFIGGAEELYALEAEGKLEQKLSK